MFCKRPSPFAAALAYCCDADACFQASVAARPRTLVPVRMTWKIIRCAWVVCQSRVTLKHSSTNSNTAM